MTNIDFFKSQAKFLKKDFNKNDYISVGRYDAVFSNNPEPTLMNFYHVIAREACFNNWNELVASNNEQLSVAKILYQNQTLNGNGIRFNWQRLTKLSLVEQKKERWNYRREILEKYVFLYSLSAFLRQNITQINTLNRFRSSYKIKHMVERSMEQYGFIENYVSNGELIVAATLAGFSWKPCTSDYQGLSVYLNMSQKSLKLLPGYR
jgi:hypothetical protein